MDTIQIKHKTTGAVIFEHICEGNNIAVTLKAASNLVETNLYGANLVGAIGVVSFGPVGNENRICYAYVNNGIQFRIGCFNGDHNQAIEAIREKYGEFSNYEMMVRSAAWTLACKQIEKE